MKRKLMAILFMISMTAFSAQKQVESEAKLLELENQNISDIINNFDKDAEDDTEIVKQDQEELEQELLSNYDQIDNIILYEKLMNSYNEWVGTKYAWGGDSKRGIDCSAFTRRIYRKVFNYELPRVSVYQVAKGIKVERKNLKPGDLIFFRPLNRLNHVGIYLGKNLFMNSSSSKGVTIASLKNSYWNKYYKYSVRIDEVRKVDDEAWLEN